MQGATLPVLSETLPRSPPTQGFLSNQFDSMHAQEHAGRLLLWMSESCGRFTPAFYRNLHAARREKQAFRVRTSIACHKALLDHARGSACKILEFLFMMTGKLESADQSLEFASIGLKEPKGS